MSEGARSALPERPPSTPPAAVPGSRRFPALAYRDFRTLWLGMLFASGTMAFQYYAQLWLIYSITESALVLGVLGATRGIATLVFGLYGGALADRMDRRKLLIVTETVALVVSLIISVMAIAGVLQLWQAFALIFIGSATMSIDAPIRQALIPELVPREHIPNAVALTTAARMGTFAIAPVLAGFVIDWLGPGGAYAASPFGSAIVLVALLALRYRGGSTAATREPVLRNIRDGLAYTRENRTVLWIIVIMFTTGAFGMAIYNGLIVKWAGEVLRMEPGQYGVLASTWGIGTLIVAYGMAFIGDIPHKGKILVYGSIAFGLSFALFGLTRSLPVAAFAYLINGAAWTGANIAASSMVQSTVPNEVRGRVMSLYMINGSAAQLNGIVLGATADRIGMAILLPATTLLLSGIVIALAVAVPTLRRLDRRVSKQVAALDRTLSTDGR